jgi:hypothetical protein
VKCRTIALIILCIVPTLCVQSEPRPNFSGTLQKSRLEIKNSPIASKFIIKHREPKWHLKRTHIYSGGKHNTWSISLITDGQHEQVQHDGSGGQAITRMYWDGDVLVLDMRITDARGLTGANVVRYSLSTDGRTMTALEHEEYPGAKLTNSWVFEKQPTAKPVEKLTRRH